MVKCLSCCQEIESLEWTGVVHRAGTLSKNSDGSIETDEDGMCFSNEADFIYSCPECGAELFYNTYEAQDFLKQTEVAEW